MACEGKTFDDLLLLGRNTTTFPEPKSSRGRKQPKVRQLWSSTMLSPWSCLASQGVVIRPVVSSGKEVCHRWLASPPAERGLSTRLHTEHPFYSGMSTRLAQGADLDTVLAGILRRILRRM